jgi:hypothetical protein
MDEPTTTPSPENEGGLQPQPDDQAQQVAAVSQEPSNVQQPQEPSEDDNSIEWLVQQKGVDPTSPDAIEKVARMYREAEKRMHDVTTKASQLDKSLQAPQQSDEFKEFISDYKRDKMLNQFKDSTPDWREHEPVMVEKLAETVNTPYGVYTRSDLVNAGILTLHDVYAMARGSAPQQKSEDVQQVLRSIANKQLAGANTPNAIKSTPSGAPDPILEAIKRAREA